MGKVVFSNISTSISHAAAYNTLRDLRKKLVQKLTKVPMGTIIDTPTGVYKTIIVDKVEALEVPLAHLFSEMTANILIPIAIVVYLLILNPIMALLSLVTVIIAIVIMAVGMRGFAEKGKVAIATIGRMTSAMIEYVSGIEVIKAFSMSAGSYQKYSQSVNESSKFFIDWMKESQKMMCSYNAVLPSVLIGILPVGLIMWQTENLTTYAFISTIIFGIALVTSIMESFTFMNSLGMLSDFTGEVYSVLEEKELVHRDNNVDLMGSGKSTIEKLIASYWQADEGVISIGGHKLEDIHLEQIAKEISYVSQDNFLFNRAIMENIRIGNQNASDDEVINAAKKVVVTNS